MDLTFVDNEHRRRFELHDGETVAAFSVYSRRPDAVVVTHTEVDPAYEGQGVGSRLVRDILDLVRNEDLRLLPECPFVRAYVGRHWDEYSDVIVGMDPPPGSSG
jgi:uncharacterized protein